MASSIHRYSDENTKSDHKVVYDSIERNGVERNKLYYSSRLHRYPCAPERRVGDLGNVRSLPNGKAYYRAVFQKTVDFLDLVGGSCVLYSKASSPCEVWEDGCKNIENNYNVIARGIIGVAKSTLNVAKMDLPPTFDCTSTLTVYGRAHLRPFSNRLL